MLRWHQGAGQLVLVECRSSAGGAPAACPPRGCPPPPPPCVVPPAADLPPAHHHSLRAGEGAGGGFGVAAGPAAPVERGAPAGSAGPRWWARAGVALRAAGRVPSSPNQPPAPVPSASLQQKYQQYLGCTPESDARGVLQVRWPGCWRKAVAGRGLQRRLAWLPARLAPLPPPDQLLRVPGPCRTCTGAPDSLAIFQLTRELLRRLVWGHANAESPQPLCPLRLLLTRIAARVAHLRTHPPSPLAAAWAP